MPKLTPEEAARIAMQYDAVVPDDVEVEKVPTGRAGDFKLHMTRREAVNRARKVYQRMKKFQRAKAKADGRTESDH